jgi:miniconductance mechanosensitive channel
MLQSFVREIAEWLRQQGMAEHLTDAIAAFLLFGGFMLLSMVTYFIARKVLLSIIIKASRKSETKWDDVLVEHKFFGYIANLIPAYIVYIITPLIFEDYPKTTSAIQTILSVFMAIFVIMAVNAFLNAVAVIYQDLSVAKSRPIKGYVQFVKILVILIGLIIILANLFGKNPLGLIGGLGAFSAVLMLIFKDPILGFVGGIQLSVNKMLAPGDWISMPKFDADGTVIDISLTTVKVQNWDKSISMIPTYSLISDSFRNWKGMEESDGRRIKRWINIDVKSIRFCTPEMLQKFEKIEYLTDYIQHKQKELEEYNALRNVDNSIMVNGRRQTNIGVFRAYLVEYLRNHPNINPEMTLMVRQLQPTEKGLPIEIYGFSKIKAWEQYEAIQSDIFDHVLAVVPEFDLRIFQNRTGDDVAVAAALMEG